MRWGGIYAIALVVVMSDGVLRYQLDNGLTVLLAPRRASPVVAMQAWVGVGAADELQDEQGIAHVFEHMLFKGTARRGLGEIARDVESAGGEINAWTSFNQTVYHVVLASRYLHTAIDVLADALQHSSFDADELAREREVILEEIRQGQDDPGRNVAQALFSTAYARHPYRWPVIGTTESVQRMTRSRLLEFFNTWYVANNLTLVLSGDFDAEGVREPIARAFGSLRSALVPRRKHREPPQTLARTRLITQDVSMAQLAVGFHIPELRSPEIAALDVLSVALGQGESSRLNTVVKKERGLVNSIYGYAHSLRDPGLFIIGATVSPDNVDAALGAAMQETFRLTIEDLTESELDKARRVIRADAIYQEETAQGAARKHGFFEVLAGEAEYEAEYLRIVGGMTPERVREAAARYVTLENMTVAALLPQNASLTRARVRNARSRRFIKLGEQAHARAVRSARRPAALPRTRSDVVRDVLPNGIRVVVKRDPTVPMIAMRAVWLGGLRYETAANNGINQLLASMITRGCGERTPDEVVRTIDDLAGVLSGFSGRNSFGIRSEWLAEDWERGFDLTADCLLRPRFPNTELMRERRQLLDLIAARRDSPSHRVFRRFAEALYRKHPYRLNVLGSTESVGKLTRKQVSDYYARNYPMRDMTLAIVGDVDPQRVIRRVHDAFGSAPGGRRRRRNVPQEDAQRGRPGGTEVYDFLDRQQAHMVIGFPATTVDDPDRYPLEVLATVLSGQGGRLFVELRDRQGLAYRVGAFSVEGIDPGYLAVYIACSPEKLAAAHRGIVAELQRLVDEPVPADELERATRYLIGAHEISLQRRASVASALAFHEAYGLGYGEYARYADAIAKVTPEQVQRVAREYIDWDVAVIATVKPPDLSPAAARRAGRTR